MAERVAGAIGLTVVHVFALLYTIPVVAGYEIDCGPLDRGVCEEVWQAMHRDCL